MNIVLLSGGSGQRMWPLSNSIRSKQFIKLFKNEKGEYNFGTIQALTKIFHEMDLTVVAEGAEKIEEVSELIRVGVDRIQGYVYSKPLTEVELVKFYKKLS